VGKKQMTKEGLQLQEKERRLLYAPILNCRGDVVVDEGVDE
jgi:hypothetical protein